LNNFSIFISRKTKEQKTSWGRRKPELNKLWNCGTHEINQVDGFEADAVKYGLFDTHLPIQEHERPPAQYMAKR
jgi:hypothetical protein